MDAGSSITKLLQRWREGDDAALHRVAPLVYDDLRRMAARRLRGEKNARTLQPTALVHEAFLRMAGNPPECASRGDLFGSANHVMRQVLVQHARARGAEKRGGGQIAVPLDESLLGGSEDRELREALAELRKHDPRKATVIELRYFGGFTVSEIAGQLRLSISTVERDLRLALAWVRRELTT